MSSHQVSASVPPGSLVAGRYMVERPLGRGGMGSVYAVFDTSTDKRLALKYLLRDPAAGESIAKALFQREYHTLAHLRHPRVIQVFDYGVAEGRPYYTMELLDGHDLRELAPMPWPRACAVLRDVASSLALLHSRRLLHRDLSTRNVRCTRDGQAKLIDFGTMTPMGVAKDIAGTPPYMAPEAVHGQELDARTDLYALGALAYWTLTGSEAYPARDVRELRRFWHRPIAAPSALVRDLPESLDALVLSLLSLDLHARPASAAEVIERLTAIADLTPMEQLDVARSYLCTPTLIGHGETLARFHKRLVGAARGRGSALFVEGRPGLGRSRVLQAFVLEAKLCGVLVLSADGEDAVRGGSGVVQRLLDALVESAPDIALETFEPYASVLGALLPELHARLPRPPQLLELGRREEEARISVAVREWLLRVSQRRPVMVVVDDVEQADDLSQICLALLAKDALEHRLVVALSTASEAADELRSLRSLATTAARVDLRPMDRAHTIELLSSVFGDVPNLRTVANWAHALSQGSPRTLMELSQHLVDQRIARYERGRWWLPESMEDRQLPASIEQALDQLVSCLSAPARALADALSLTTDRGHLELDEVVALSAGRGIRETYAAVDELVATQVVASTGSRYAIRHRGLTHALQRGLQEERARALHLRLAQIYARRFPGEGAEAEAPLLAAYHHYRAGDLEGAATLLTRRGVYASQPFARSHEAVEMMEACLARAGELELPPAAVFPLRKALVSVSASSDLQLRDRGDQLLDQLLRDSGLALYGQLSDEPDPARRVRRCIGRAARRYESTPAEQRGLPPERALRELASTVLILASSYTARSDLAALLRLRDVLAPARSLTAELDLLQVVVENAADSLSGLSIAAGCAHVLERVAQPLDGLSDSARDALRVVSAYWLAMEQATTGDHAALDWAAKLDTSAPHGGMAWQVRTVSHLFRGHDRDAEEARQRREALAVERRLGDATQSRGVLYELEGHYRCGDLLGVRQMLEYISDLASRYTGWRREELLARGRYALLRGEAWVALSAFEQADDILGQAEALLELGKGRSALSVLDSRLDGVRLERLHPMYRWPIEVCRARAMVQAEEPAAGALYLDRVISDSEAAELGGVLSFMIYEARARIALAMDDAEVFRAQIRRLGRMADSRASVLRGRYEQITSEARRALFSVPPEPPQPVTAISAKASSDVRTQLESTLSASQRLAHGLRLLTKHAGASQGFLFGLHEDGLRLRAATDGRVPPEGLLDMLGFYLSAELDVNPEADPHTRTGTFEVSPDMVAFINDGHRVYYPVLLGSVRDQQRVIGGVAVLAIPFQREPDLPRDLVAQVSEALLESGDLIPTRAPA